MSLKRETGYRVDDHLFAKKGEAELYLSKKRLAEMTDDVPDAKQLDEWMISQGWRLINILSDIARRGGTKKEGA